MRATLVAFVEGRAMSERTPQSRTTVAGLTGGSFYQLANLLQKEREIYVLHGALDFIGDHGHLHHAHEGLCRGCLKVCFVEVGDIPFVCTNVRRSPHQ